MKIFAVIHNYGRPVPGSLMGEGETMWYDLPDSTVLRSGNPFFVPDFDSEFTAFPSICFRIGRLGKSISSRFAHRYIDAWTGSVTAVATGVLRRLREKGMPWTKAIAFDRSFMIGNLQPIDTFINYAKFSVSIDDEKMEYDTGRLRKPVESIIELISSDNTLKTGDLLLAGLTPCGIFLNPGKRLRIGTNSHNMNLLDINIR